jgi:hypothetical protein
MSIKFLTARIVEVDGTKQVEIYNIEDFTPAIYVSTPSSSTSEGAHGQWSYDDDFLYIHNGIKWKRIPMSNWGT